MVVLKLLDRTLMDREALAQWLRRGESTIRKHCQPCGKDIAGRNLYHAEACAEVMAEVRTRGPRTGVPKRPAKPRTLGYDGVHARLRRGRGKADSHSCDFCGAQAFEWAYDHYDADEVTDDRGRVFSLDPDHYVPLCRFCHKSYDARHAARNTCA